MRRRGGQLSKWRILAASKRPRPRSARARAPRPSSASRTSLTSSVLTPVGVNSPIRSQSALSTMRSEVSSRTPRACRPARPRLDRRLHRVVLEVDEDGHVHLVAKRSVKARAGGDRSPPKRRSARRHRPHPRPPTRGLASVERRSPGHVGAPAVSGLHQPVVVRAESDRWRGIDGPSLTCIKLCARPGRLEGPRAF